MLLGRSVKNIACLSYVVMNDAKRRHKHDRVDYACDELLKAFFDDLKLRGDDRDHLPARASIKLAHLSSILGKSAWRERQHLVVHNAVENFL